MIAIGLRFPIYGVGADGVPLIAVYGTPHSSAAASNWSVRGTRVIEPETRYCEACGAMLVVRGCNIVGSMRCLHGEWRELRWPART